MKDSKDHDQDDRTRMIGEDKTRVAKSKTPAKDNRPSFSNTKPPSRETSRPRTSALEKLRSAQAAVQLTRIRKAIRDQNSSQGFVKAKSAADKALETNQIVLNGRFVLEATLGAGGMGTVYRAQDLRKVEAHDPNPFVAVKVLNEEFKNHPHAFVTLQREASRSHILSHPNIVTVHDFDRDGDVIYMTMELLQGQGLETVIRKNKKNGLPKIEALKIIRDFGQALAYAHQKHIIHSDLKPGNIFVSSTGTKVLDFGIARLTNQSKGDFDAGELGALTPAYASLEMIQGEAPHPSDDVYAAAIIAYELFCGEHPYQRKPADVAVNEKLKPRPIKGLSRQQWQTLANALKLKRKDRTQDIASFYKGLTQKKRANKRLLIPTIIGSALVAVASYRYFAESQLDKRIQTLYVEGQQCLEQEDANCALDNAKAILQVAPEHTEAQTLRTRAVHLSEQLKAQATLAALEQCISDEDIVCAERLLKQYSPLATTEQVTALRKSIEKARQHQQLTHLEAEAQRCFDDQDFQCAIQKAQEALDVGESPVAQSLLSSAQGTLQKQQREQELLTKKFAMALDSAEKCLNSKRYGCAIQHAQEAVALGVSPTKAQTFLQKAQFAQREHQKNIDRANKLTDKGIACLERKNYNCAIVNSESALEIVPNFPAAEKLRNEAKQAVEKLKQQILIQ